MKFVTIPGGSFLMGSEDASQGFDRDCEGPVSKVELPSFQLAASPVTNQDFLEFFLATGYVTDAERYGSSNVCYLLLDPAIRSLYPLAGGTDWWHEVEDACWRLPEGKGSSIEDRMDHPVVHVSYNDARAYALWAGCRLATEAEWEYAAYGGMTDQRKYPWGHELEAGGKHHANVWQGSFPEENTMADGYLGTAPVETYEPNGYGLYQMIGNVWEWCLNPGRIPLSEFQVQTAADFQTTYRGYQRQEDFALRGGSFLCHHSYCQRYRIQGRNANNALSSTSNVGFRCARDLH